jgi:hypothetical protein
MPRATTESSCAARENAAARGDQRLVVVVPRRTRQVEHALALGERLGDVGIGVDEDVAMVERSDEADVLGQQHAVAEHVAGHVADADAGEVLRLRIAAERAEMALDRFPRALRGDAHFLVVVADRAARRERVAEPEAVFGADAVGDVGERRRALVGGDHEVRIVAIMAHHVPRRHDLAVDEVVGDVEQAVDEHLVAGDAFGEYGVAVAASGRALDEETALRADRHDDCVLHHLRFHEAEHFRAEILAAIRPAQAAARDGAETQVHAFDARAVDEDFPVRTRLGQIRHLRRIELEADVVVRLAVAAVLEIVRAQRRADDAEIGAQDAILVEAGDVFEQRLDRGDERGDLLRARLRACGDERVDEVGRELGERVRRDQRAQFGVELLRGIGRGRAALLARRIETGFEQFDEQAGDRRIAVERFFHVALRERHAGLQEVLAVAAQHRNLAPRQARAEDELVERVVFGVAAPDLLERGLEGRADLRDVERTTRLRLHDDVLDAQLRVAEVELVELLGEHLEVHVFEQRDRFRQRDILAVAEDLEVQRVGIAARRHEAEADVVFPAELCGERDIGGGAARRRRLDVGGRQRRIARGERAARGIAVAFGERVAQFLVPVADDAGDLLFERVDVVGHVVARLRADDQVQQRQRRFVDLDGRIDLGAAQRCVQRGRNALARVAGQAFARQVDEAGIEAAVLVATHEQARTRRARSASTPVARSNNSSSLAWNNSSRGSSSSTWRNALPEYASRRRPERLSTASTLRRTSGTSCGRAM